jgi:large subunit ribosomal protein L22
MYTYKPKEPHAKAFGRNLPISTKNAQFVCKLIRGKKLNQSRRLLLDMKDGRRSINGKTYTKTVAEILELIGSCEKNAEFKGLDSERLFIHASAHKGFAFRRRRRKSAFGSRLKRTHVEIILIEKGKLKKASKDAKKEKHDVGENGKTKEKT